MTRKTLAAGEVFNKLSVITDKGDLVDCRCECGSMCTVRKINLKSGNTRSCGCLRAAINSERLRTHGATKTPEYQAFKMAKRRCNNPNAHGYKFYGGRGIEFRFSNFETFLAEIGSRPSSAYSLDRINVNGHYDPNNVRWANWKTQANNRRPRNSA